MVAAGRTRVALAAAFLLHGAVTGSWAARVPWVQDRLALSPGVLGLALLMPAIGSVVALPWSGRIVASHGSRVTTGAGLLALCASVGLLTAVPTLPWLAATLFGYGVAGALTDVAMNDNAVAFEARLGRRVLSGAHAMWSLGTLLGGAVGALVAHFDVAAPVHLGAVAVLVAAAVPGTARWLEAAPPRLAATATAFVRPSRGVVALGLLCAAAMFAEGAANEWSAVYAHRVDRVDPGTAATAFTAFALAMVVGRLAGDGLTRRFGPVRTLRCAGGVGTAGAVVVAAVPVLPATVAGFALLGLGLAVGVPLAFGAAGHGGGERSGHAIAAVATLGYIGWLAAPAVIGGVAQVASLQASFAVVGAVTALLVWLAGAVRPAGTARTSGR